MRFGDFEILQDQRVLLVRGRPVAIGSRAFDVLVALAVHAGVVVGKAALFEAAWPGLVVEENNLTVQVSTLRKLLGPQAIRTVAGVGYQLIAAAAAMPQPAEVRHGSAPRAMALVGRDEDEASLASRLDCSRLVSIVGSGGVGKTALAKKLIENFADVEWVDLAPLQDEMQVAPLVAKRLGIALDAAGDLVEELTHALADRHLLVVLDNCEHVLGAVARIVGAALGRATDVRWLTTSREPLRVPGEMIHRLQPLEVPSGVSRYAPVEARRWGAVALMCDRLADGDHRFALTSANVDLVIALCARLDGLPLAIEMAAARVTTLGLRTVVDQLDRRLTALTGPRGGPLRQQTLRGTFDWSYALLSADERRCFRRLQPFVGGFGLPMAAVVTASDDRRSIEDETILVSDLLHALVDKSLVQRSADGPLRFFLFESARRYAFERLQADNETEVVARRHATAVADFFDAALADQDRLGDASWSAIYVVERHNVRAALGYLCEARTPGDRDADLLARLVAAFASIDLFLREPNEVLTFDIPLDVLAQAQPRFRAHACLKLGWAHFFEGSRRLAGELNRMALEDFDALGEVSGIYRALAQSLRLAQSLSDGDAGDAATFWKRLERIDGATVPLAVRLSCEMTIGGESGRWPLERLQHWKTLANAAGFDALAASCDVHAIDELLIARRFDEALAGTEQFLDEHASRLGFVGAVMLNQTLALVQLGRGDEAWAAARSAMRTLPRRSHLAFVSLALDAARQGRFTEAAMMLGYYEGILADRDETLDLAEADAHAETTRTLASAMQHVALREWTTAGASMRPADFLASHDGDVDRIGDFSATRDARRGVVRDRRSLRG